MHELKVLPEYFSELSCERKNFEIRRNDRNFHIGDYLNLYEWSKETGYTGKSIRRRIKYILSDSKFGLKDGYVALALHVPKKERNQ